MFGDDVFHDKRVTDNNILFGNIKFSSMTPTCCHWTKNKLLDHRDTEALRNSGFNQMHYFTNHLDHDWNDLNLFKTSNKIVLTKLGILVI